MHRVYPSRNDHSQCAPKMKRMTKTVTKVRVCVEEPESPSFAKSVPQIQFSLKTKALSRLVPLLWTVSYGVQSAIDSMCPRRNGARARLPMTQNNDHTMMEEVVLPEHLLPLGSVLGQGVTALDLCMVLAKIFKVQYTEVALLRLEGG